MTRAPRLSACGAALCLSATLAGAQQRDLAAMTDSIFSRWNSTHTPGCAVGIAHDGRTLLTRGYGMANLETGTPLTAETVLESGSVAKQFTATAVILLAMDGKLSLDDPVRKHIPEFPQYDKPITIRHLLTHTSGLREWSNLVAAAGWPRGDRAHTQADLLDVVYRQKSLNYPVGETYSYTNSGYAVAMSLVERVSGMSFQEFTQSRIFKPLGMTSTQWRDDFTRVVPGRGQAYRPSAGGWALAMPFEDVVGPGGLLTTVGDWLIWNEALATSALRPGLTDSLTRRMIVNSGRRISYALGVTVSDYRGTTQVAHSGSTGGYSTYLARYPDRGNLSVAVMCNSTQGNATQYTRQIVDRLLTDLPPATAPAMAPVDAAAFARHLGVYRSERTHAPLLLDDAVAARARTLPGGWFFINNAPAQFDVGRDGKPTGLRVIQADDDTVRFVYVSERPWRPTPQDLRAFEGSYRSDEVGATYELRVSGDSLLASVRPGVSVPLSPTYPDAFQRGGRTVWFTRDGRGRVTAMHFGEARLWDLVLTRVR